MLRIIGDTWDWFSDHYRPIMATATLALVVVGIASLLTDSGSESDPTPSPVVLENIADEIDEAAEDADGFHDLTHEDITRAAKLSRRTFDRAVRPVANDPAMELDWQEQRQKAERELDGCRERNQTSRQTCKDKFKELKSSMDRLLAEAVHSPDLDDLRAQAELLQQKASECKQAAAAERTRILGALDNLPQPEFGKPKDQGQKQQTEGGKPPEPPPVKSEQVLIALIATDDLIPLTGQVRTGLLGAIQEHRDEVYQAQVFVIKRYGRAQPWNAKSRLQLERTECFHDKQPVEEAFLASQQLLEELQTIETTKTVFRKVIYIWASRHAPDDYPRSLASLEMPRDCKHHCIWLAAPDEATVSDKLDRWFAQEYTVLREGLLSQFGLKLTTRIQER